MRKSPTYNTTIICKMCGKEAARTAAVQFYCDECKPIASALRKKKWYVKNNPNAYAVKEEKVCSVCGEKFASYFNGVPYCNKHYLRMLTHGTPDKLVRKSKNTYLLIDDYAEAKTTKGETFFIDACDVEKAFKHTWCISKTGYLVANINHKVTKLHRHLLGLTDPRVVVDHINGNPLDNRRRNLRICANSENAKNTTLQHNNPLGCRGVRKTRNNTYNVRITVDRQGIHVGNFKTFEEAVAARNNAEAKYYGEFAPSKSR